MLRQDRPWKGPSIAQTARSNVTLCATHAKLSSTLRASMSDFIVCSAVQSAHATSSIQHTAYNMQHTTCSIQHAAYNIERFSQRSFRPQRALLTDLFTSAYRVIRCGAGRDAAAAEWNTVVRLAGIDQLSIASAAPLVYLLSTYAK